MLIHCRRENGFLQYQKSSVPGQDSCGARRRVVEYPDEQGTVQTSDKMNFDGSVQKVSDGMKHANLALENTINQMSPFRSSS
jgi:hypothetical protein